MLETYDDALADYPEINADNYVPEAWNIGDLEDSRYSDRKSTRLKNIHQLL